MLKVLIVDDEQIIRTGLITKFDWETSNCVPVAAASDYHEAIQAYKEFSPDIIITDINMPKPNGLDLMRDIRKINPDVEFIVISGYDDFSYAKSALESNAAAYLLKPIKFPELHNILDKLNEKIESRKTASAAMSGYNSLKSEQVLMRLLGSSSEQNEVLSETLNKEYSGENYMLALLTLDNRRNLPEDRLLTINALTAEHIEETIQAVSARIIKCNLESGKFVLLFFLDDSFYYLHLYKLLNQINIWANESLGATFTIGLSGIFRNIQMLKTAFSQATDALKYRAIIGNNRIIDYITINSAFSSNSTLSAAEFKELISHIKNHEYDIAKKILDAFFVKIYRSGDVSLEKLKESICELAIVIINFVRDDAGSVQFVFGREIKPILELSELELVSDIQNWIISMLNVLSEFDALHKDSDIKTDAVKTAIGYIITNYNKPLTVDSIAKQLFISTRHLMRCFKNETGYTFNEYLTQYRMKKAIHLLKNSNCKIYEISHLVGYNDTKYFCKLFKKVVGKSHTEFRNKNITD